MRSIHRLMIGGLSLFLLVIMLQSCSPAKGDSPGHEYMPDMFHSIAYEANLYDYYSYNTWGSEEEYKKLVMPKEPVEGTIPIGYAAMQNPMDDMGEDIEEVYSHIPMNGAVPYYYEDTEEERTRAMNEITLNPYPISKEGLDKGEELYDIYCGICHGENGDGAGYLLRDDGGVYPVQPANLLLEEFVNASEGRYYHSIMFGKNVMGAYADKLSYEERWQVIHYIRALQAKELSLPYNENENGMTNGAIPMGTIAPADDHAMHEASEENGLHETEHADSH